MGHNSWAGKAAGVLGTSPSAAGTALMQQHLRNILAAEGASTLTTPEVFLQYSDGLVNDQYEITNEGTRKFLQAGSTATSTGSASSTPDRRHDRTRLVPASGVLRSGMRRRRTRGCGLIPANCGEA